MEPVRVFVKGGVKINKVITPTSLEEKGDFPRVGRNKNWRKGKLIKSPKNTKNYARASN